MPEHTGQQPHTPMFYLHIYYSIIHYLPPPFPLFEVSRRVSVTIIPNIRPPINLLAHPHHQDSIVLYSLVTDRTTPPEIYTHFSPCARTPPKSTLHQDPGKTRTTW